MASLTILADPYARALFDIAVEKKCADKWLNNLEILNTAASAKEFNDLLNNPAITTEDIIKLIVVLLQENADKDFLNFIQVLGSNNRLNVLGSVYEVYADLLYKYKNQCWAVIESAYELSAEDELEIKQKLAEKYSKQVEVKVKINSNLLAGVKITIGDDVIDGSIQGRLQKLATQISK